MCECLLLIKSEVLWYRLKALLAEKAEDVKGKAALKQLVTRCAKELTTAQRKSLPADMKDIVQKRWEKIQEKLALYVLLFVQRYI